MDCVLAIFRGEMDIIIIKENTKGRLLYHAAKSKLPYDIGN